MGQRLNIEIISNGKCLANAYYHWSAYSDSAIDLAIKIVRKYEYIKEYKRVNTENEKLLFAIRLLEVTGAGLFPSEIERAKDIIKTNDNYNIKFKPCINRNEGIIEFTEKGIEENRSWEEGRISIDIDNKTINYKVYDIIDEKSKEEIEKTENIKLVPMEIDFNFDKISFEKIFELWAIISKAKYKENYYLKNNGEIIELIF